MDHLKEIKRLVGKALDDRTMPMPGQIVYLKPDPTVALFEAHSNIECLRKLYAEAMSENKRLQLLVYERSRQLQCLRDYCREQEQPSSNRHRIRGVYRKTSQGDYVSYPIVSVGGDAGGLDIYIG